MGASDFILIIHSGCAMKTKRQSAYSLVELIIVVVFLGIIAAIAVPRLNFSATSRYKADTIARKIVTDLRRTRRLAISDAANNTAGFALNMIGPSPYNSYAIENLSTGVTIDSQTIAPEISCAGGTAFQFGPMGNLKVGSDTQLSISASGRTFVITITIATGTVKCTES